MCMVFKICQQLKSCVAISGTIHWLWTIYLPCNLLLSQGLVLRCYRNMTHRPTNIYYTAANTRKKFVFYMLDLYIGVWPNKPMLTKWQSSDPTKIVLPSFTSVLCWWRLGCKHLSMCNTFVMLRRKISWTVRCKRNTVTGARTIDSSLYAYLLIAVPTSSSSRYNMGLFRMWVRLSGCYVLSLCIINSI